MRLRNQYTGIIRIIELGCLFVAVRFSLVFFFIVKNEGIYIPPTHLETLFYQTAFPSSLHAHPVHLSSAARLIKHATLAKRNPRGADMGQPRLDQIIAER